MLRDPDTSLVGRTIAGKFDIEAVIGGGAMGAVYRARQIALDKHVAIKVMHRELSSDPNYVARFLREAKAASRIDHPSSVRVIDFGEEPDGLLYLAMELLEGHDLYTVLKQEGPLPVARVGDILLQVLAAVAVAHEVGVVHRDIKPENIMIQSGTDDEGRPRDFVKVCDFGVAKLTDRDSDTIKPIAGPAITTEGLVVGTPEYMSPEQGRGESLDSRSDLYSIGVILYQMLAGKVPFEAASALGIVLKHVTEEPMLPSHIRAEADPALEAVCIRAMKKKREDRYATAREMRADVRTALGDHAIDGMHARDGRTTSSAEGAAAIVAAVTEPAPRFVPAVPAAPAIPHDPTPVVPQVARLQQPALAPAPLPSNLGPGVGTSDTAVAFDSSAIRPAHKSSPVYEPAPMLTPAALPKPRLGGILLGGLLLVGAGGAIAYKLRGIQVAPDPPSMGTTIVTESSAPAVRASSVPSSRSNTPPVVDSNKPSTVPVPVPAHAAVVPTPHDGKRAGKPDASASANDLADASALAPTPSAFPATSPIASVVDPSLNIAPPLDPGTAPAPITLTPTPTPVPAPNGPWNKNTSKVSVLAVRAIGVPTATLRAAVPDAKLERCYRGALVGTGPKPEASKITLHVDANDEGRVTSASLDGGPPIPKAAGNCVLKAMVGRQVTSDGTFLVSGDIDLSFSVD